MMGLEKLVGDVGHGIDDEVRAVGEFCKVIPGGVAAEDENGFVAHADAAEDVGFHIVTDHDGFGGADAEFVLGHAHHDAAGFADGECLSAGCSFDHGDDGTAAWPDAGVGRAGGIRVGGDEAGTLFDETHAAFDHLKCEGPALADDDVVGIVIDDGVAIVLEGDGETVFANDKGGAVRFLFGEETGGGHGTGEDVAFLRKEAEAAEF